MYPTSSSTHIELMFKYQYFLYTFDTNSHVAYSCAIQNFKSHLYTSSRKLSHACQSQLRLWKRHFSEFFSVLYCSEKPCVNHESCLSYVFPNNISNYETLYMGYLFKTMISMNSHIST